MQHNLLKKYRSNDPSSEKKAYQIYKHYRNQLLMLKKKVKKTNLNNLKSYGKVMTIRQTSV